MYGFSSLLGIPCFRFTEELFATLIAFIFIFNAFKKLMAIRATSIVLDALNCESCNCTTKNLTQVTLENITKTYCEENSGTWVSVNLNSGLPYYNANSLGSASACYISRWVDWGQPWRMSVSLRCIIIRFYLSGL